jgi:hypothetical protein
VLVVATELRLGKAVDGLDVEFEETRTTGVGWIVRERLHSPIQKIAVPSEPRVFTERVHDERRGLLYEAGPLVFNLGCCFTTYLVTEARHVSCTGADGAPERYQTPLRGEPVAVEGSGKRDSSRKGIARLEGAQARRTRRERGNAEQKWFRAQASDALAELRQLVGKAHDQVLLVDPYFGGEDFDRVLLAIQDPGVPVRVLTGAEHLRRHNKRHAMEESEYLEIRVAEAQAAGRMNPVELHVMQGDAPAIHDRLLRVGADVWMLGSSLNAFGSRGTLLVKAPDPEPILSDVEAVWKESPEFSNWLAERRATRGR